MFASVSRRRRVGVAPYGLLIAAFVFPSSSFAQNREVWGQGTWTAIAPPAAACGVFPVVQVKGPGSILDPAHEGVFAQFEKVLPAILAKACPGATEALLVSGSGRKLWKAGEAQEPPQQQASQAAPAAAAPPAAPRAAPAPVAPGAPVLAAPGSDLPNLESARKAEDKCEVLIKWLESGKMQQAAAAAGGAPGAPNYNYRYRQPTQSVQFSIFRDEPMTAVFGMPYDKTENRWRMEQHEKAIGPCIGFQSTRASRNPFADRDKILRMQGYWQQFGQYRSILDHAFLGQPGQYEPVAITRYVQQVRAQTGWANQVISTAATAPATIESFNEMHQMIQALPAQANLLGADQRKQVADYLGVRRAALASAIVDDGLRKSAAAPKVLASARALTAGRAALANVIQVLDAQAKANFESSYDRLVESMIGDPVRAETAKLASIPATAAGAGALVAWKTNFDTGFREFAGIPLVVSALQQFDQARARVYPVVLPAWQKKIETSPLDSASLAAQRRELDALFPAPQDRTAPVFSQFDSPLRRREEQLRTATVEADRKERDARAAAQRRELEMLASAPLPVASGTRQSRSSGGDGQKQTDQEVVGEGGVLIFPSMIQALRLGRVDLIPDDQLIRSYFFSFLKGINNKCSATAESDLQMAALQYGSPMFQSGSGKTTAEVGAEVLARMAKGMADMQKSQSMGDMLNSMNSVLPPSGLISEGISDGGTVAETWKCNTMTNLKIRASLRNLILARKDRPPAPADRNQFLLLMNPEYRKLRGLPEPR